MGLGNIGSDLFKDRNSIEGVSPEIIDVSRQDDLTQNITKGAAIITFTTTGAFLPTQTGSFINLYNLDLTKTLKFAEDDNSNIGTATIILDLGKPVLVRNTILNLTIVDSAGNARVTTSHSLDNSSYTQIDQDTNDGTYDHTLATTKYRFLKIYLEVLTAIGDASYISLNGLLMAR